MRVRRPRPEPNHERWLVSYADFITLLFAFFVVMFAASRADKSKAKRVSEAFSAAIAGTKRSDGGAPTVLPPQPQLQPALAQLRRELQDEIRTGKMQVRMEARGLVVSLNQTAFFPSGEDGIDPATFGSLGKVAAAIRRLPNPIRAEGHTDSLPIHTARFRSNWDLSAARAIAILNVLRDQWQIPPDRLSIAGYADVAPLAPNDTESGRAQNRRVDLVILNDSDNPERPPLEIAATHKGRMPD